MEHIDLETLAPKERYKLLTGLVVPRPIAWVTTLSANGEVNAAPFSFFNVFGSNPPIAMLGTGRRPEGGLKDTALNLKERRQAVIHLVEEDLVEAMSRTSAPLPHGDSELPYAGLETEPVPGFPVPAIKGTRVRLLSELVEQRTYGHNLVNVLEIKAAVVQPGLRDPETGYIANNFAPVARLSGSGYCRSTDRFEIERP